MTNKTSPIKSFNITPFRIENAQCNVSFSLKSANFMGRLNEKRCKIAERCNNINLLINNPGSFVMMKVIYPMILDKRLSVGFCLKASKLGLKAFIIYKAPWIYNVPDFRTEVENYIRASKERIILPKK